jgi:hypothetical protein
MRTVKVKMVSDSPYSQSKMHEAEKLPKERPGDYEVRTWREKCTTDANGQIVIPAMALKFSLAAAAKKLGMQIPGRGKATFTKYFEADVICVDNPPLDVQKDDVDSVRINANADGVRGSGKRVWRTFPVINQWESEATFMIMDDTITKEVFEEVFTAAGMGIGIGRFRPEKGGINGRFSATAFEWVN